MTENPKSADLASKMAIAINRLNTRLREQTGKTGHGLTLSQIAMLHRLDDHGVLSVSALATAEHVSQQAVTQRLALLEPTGYISVTPDPVDRRSKLVGITPEGRALLTTYAALGERWLADAIEETCDEEQKRTLRNAADLMERLAMTDRGAGDPQR